MEARSNQKSTYVKNLSKDELPDSMKNIDMSKIPKQNISDVMYTGLEDESIQKYKESLLGNLSTKVKDSVKVRASIERKFRGCCAYFSFSIVC